MEMLLDPRTAIKINFIPPRLKGKLNPDGQSLTLLNQFFHHHMEEIPLKFILASPFHDSLIAFIFATKTRGEELDPSGRKKLLREMRSCLKGYRRKLSIFGIGQEVAEPNAAGLRNRFQWELPRLSQLKIPERPEDEALAQEYLERIQHEADLLRTEIFLRLFKSRLLLH